MTDEEYKKEFSKHGLTYVILNMTMNVSALDFTKVQPFLILTWISLILRMCANCQKKVFLSQSKYLFR